MAYTASKLLEVARAEIGYKEKESNKNLDNPTANAGDENYTKYARDLRAAGYYNGNKNGFDWCDVFVDWCHYMAAGKDKKVAEDTICQTGKLGAGCGYSMGYYKKQKRFFSDPQPGDQIFLGNAKVTQHTGIVEEVTDTHVIIIDGNSKNQVKRSSYKLNNKRILGYGRPKYAAEEPAATPTPEPAPVEVVLKKGDKVRMAKDAPVWGKDYKFKSWVYKKTLYVRAIDGDRIRVSWLKVGAITGSVHRKYLTKI